MIDFDCRVEILQYLKNTVLCIAQKHNCYFDTGNERKKKFKELILLDRSVICFYVTTLLLLLSFFHKTRFLYVMSDNMKDWQRKETLQNDTPVWLSGM